MHFAFVKYPFWITAVFAETSHEFPLSFNTLAGALSWHQPRPILSSSISVLSLWSCCQSSQLKITYVFDVTSLNNIWTLSLSFFFSRFPHFIDLPIFVILLPFPSPSSVYEFLPTTVFISGFTLPRLPVHVQSISCFPQSLFFFPSFIHTN
jgi:hypothetical protein